MNFIKLFIGDYMKKTGALSVQEHGAYFLTLLHYYATETPLPVGRELYRLLRAETKQERDAVDFIVSRYWVQTPEGLTHERADEEIRKASHQREVNRELGKRGGRPKKTETETESVIETEANHNPSHSHSQITPSLRSGVARATRLPPDWEPDSEAWNWAVGELGSGELFGRELAKFRDYWAARPGKGGTKLDWAATWRNWVREAKDRAENRRHSGQGPAKPASAVERVRQACGLDDDGFPLGPDDGDLRPQVDEQLRDEADRRVVETTFRVVS